MKRKVTVMMIFAVMLVAYCAFSADDKSKPAESAKHRKDFTEEEYVEHINGRLQSMPEILNIIPGLRVEKDASGKEFYTYEGANLKGLDKEKLKKIFVKIQNEATRIQTDRVNKQLESIRQAEQASRAAQQASRQVNIPRPIIQPQAVYSPPQTPPAPPNVPQPPRPPAPPPAPPRR